MSIGISAAAAAGFAGCPDDGDDHPGNCDLDTPEGYGTACIERPPMRVEMPQR